MTRRAQRSGDLVVVADVHIGRNDPELQDFCDFLRSLSSTCSTLILLGDVFALWLGRHKFTRTHHEIVLDACRGLRLAGVHVVFIEGNREFSAVSYLGDAFDEVSEELVLESQGERRWHFCHGDLFNRGDWKNRVFRAFVRSRLVLSLVGLLPSARGLALGARIERAMSTRSMGSKTALPERLFDRYLAWLDDQRYDAAAIGHLHIEMIRRGSFSGGAERRVYVLPDWKSGKRYLRIPARGEPRFEAWQQGLVAPPAITEVVTEAQSVRLRLERPVTVRVGDAVTLSSSHDAVARRGRVLGVDAADPSRVEVTLEEGPAIQVGDRFLTPAGPPQESE